MIAAAIGAVAAAVFVGLPYRSGTPATWMLLWGGAGAISVMLLPGISGSLFLLIVGQYETIGLAVTQRELVPLAVFSAGLALGVVLFIPILRRLLVRKHDLTMAVLTGLMAGSLRALWPWKTSYDPKGEVPIENTGMFGDIHWVVLGLVLGIGVVYFLTRLERRITAAEVNREGAA